MRGLRDLGVSCEPRKFQHVEASPIRNIPEAVEGTEDAVVAPDYIPGKEEGRSPECDDKFGITRAR